MTLPTSILSNVLSNLFVLFGYQENSCLFALLVRARELEEFLEDHKASYQTKHINHHPFD